MNEYNSRPSENLTHQTVLLLLPENFNFYYENLAGVPFLLRNILTLQKCGIKEIKLWLESSSGDKDPNLISLTKDPRIGSNVEWINSVKPGNADLIVLDGSILIKKSLLTQTKIQPEENQSDTSGFVFFPEALEQLSKGENNITIVCPKGSKLLHHKKDFRIAENDLLQSAGLDNDSFMDKMVTRHISRPLTHLILKTRLTPNQITFTSLIIGLGSAFCFIQGSFFSGVLGSIILLISTWIDCTDGEVARLKFMETPLGAGFDLISDNIVHLSVFFSIGMGIFFATGNPIYKFYGTMAVFGSLTSFLILSNTILQKTQEAVKNKIINKNLSDKLANRDFTYFLLAMASINRLDIFILITAIGSNLFAIYLLYQNWKLSKSID